MKSKSINFSASNAKRSVKFASVNKNSLHAGTDNNDCLLFERIANDLVNDTQFIRYSVRLFVSVLFANVNASYHILSYLYSE